ncbi:hypothetical protein ANTQUA_LOCUS9287 [Anthophora quadrimaculata]
MEDQELVALKNLRERLVIKASSLLETLKKQEGNDVTVKLLDAIKTNNNEKETSPEYNVNQLCNVSQQITNIKFENTERKWLNDNVYLYTTFLMTKVLKIYVELTVKLEGEAEFEISDITCHFVNIEECYMLEIGKWVQNITKMRNFSLLTSAISQYNEQHLLRKKLLDKLKAGKYANCEQCNSKNGGIVIYIHSPRNARQIYLIFHWSLIFLERTWQIEHHFLINPSETESTFAERNRNLLEEFCKASISKEDLMNLWYNLCSAVDSYDS